MAATEYYGYLLSQGYGEHQLNEFADYYTRLLEMEEKAEEYWKTHSEKHETSEETKELAKKEEL
jgi:hypothetical protein